MEQSNGISVFPVCPLAHTLLDKLTAIVGSCELLVEQSSADSVSSKRLQLIRQAAQSMTVELKDHQCEHIALLKYQERGMGSHPVRPIADARRQPRFKIEADIRLKSRTCGMLKGRTVDISESGIAAMLTIEAPLGEVVELTFTLPFGPVTIHARVRQRNAFRYGFEFVDSGSVHEVIRRTCHELAFEQSLDVG